MQLWGIESGPAATEMDVDVQDFPLVVENPQPSSSSDAPVVLTLHGWRVRNRMLLDVAPPCVAAAQQAPSRLRPPSEHVETPLAKSHRRMQSMTLAKPPTGTWFPPHAAPPARHSGHRPTRVVAARDKANYDVEDDSPKLFEMTYEFRKRRELVEEQTRRLLPFAVTHRVQSPRWDPRPPADKYPVNAHLHTHGYRNLGSTCHWSEQKPFTRAEAVRAGLSCDRSIQECFEADGEWNMNPNLVVDCTVLHRHHNGYEIHSGEHSTVIGRMVQDPALSPLLAGIRDGFDRFSRDPNSADTFEILCLDPYGQCRSVALARIVAYCLHRSGVNVMTNTHLAKKDWQEDCCEGGCHECTNWPMSNEKQAALARAFAVWIAAI